MQQYTTLFTFALVVLIVQLPLCLTGSVKYIMRSNRYSLCSTCHDRSPFFGCSNEPDSINHGNFFYLDTIPANNTVTEINVDLLGMWECDDYSPTVQVSLQGVMIGTFDLHGQCSCQYCAPPARFTWRIQDDPPLDYNYGGNNHIYVDIITGISCINQINVEVIYEPKSYNDDDCICSDYGECSVGETRCDDELNYQVCIRDQRGPSFWSPSHECANGTRCKSTGLHAYCQKINNTLPTVCSDGEMRCYNETSYQSCSGGKWNHTVNCAGTKICNQDPTGTNIFCIDPVYANNNTCTSRDMRCVTNTTYQMCMQIDSNGTGLWNPVQACAADHHCVSSGNAIYCVKAPTEPDCAYRSMRCAGQSSYQTCNRDPSGRTFWDTEQLCQPGLTCHVHSPYIYCY